MEDLIKQGLPNDDQVTIDKVINHLKELGMNSPEDCEYVEEAYLKDILKPIQIKKLMAFFKKFCNKYEPQVICNVEFEECDNMLVSKSPVPHLSVLPSTSSSPSSPSFEFVAQPVINWAENFHVPWGAFPKELIADCERKKRLRKCTYSDMIKILAESIERISPSPGRRNLRVICNKIINKYPETFQDRCGDSIINGCSTLMKKVEHCLENRKRRKGFSDIFDVKEGDVLKKTERNSYACTNWQPNRLLADETKETQLQHKKFLLSEYRNVDRDENEIEGSMFKTYALQRYTINSKNSVKIIKEEWPVLFENKYFINHAKILLGSDSVCEDICNNIEIKGKIIYNFMTIKGKNEGVVRCLKNIQAAKEASKSITPETLGAVLLIAAYFNEEEDELFQINMDPVSIIDLETDPKRLTPFIATSGGNIFSCDEFFIVIDGIVALKTEDFKMAVAMLILSFFVFNIEYPVKAALSLEFIQRIFANINPERGSKAPKEVKKRNMIPKQVSNLSNALRDYESHFTL